ncbi:MAG: AmmeMemoRadiSam system protein B [Balneola sp.]|nr:MAG: AmmeMemoRadiSam system protein B [Balneola sp.]
MEELLFNSYSDPIPPVRFDIQQIPHHQNGHSLVVFYDALGYLTPDFALPMESQTMLSLLDGNRSVEDILKFSSDEVTKEQVLGYIRHLDEHGLLQSEYFNSHSELIETEYEASAIHLSNTAGISYPKNPEELSTWLDEAFNTYEQSTPVMEAKALYAPHIDPRVGLSSYVKAFSAIKNLTPKKVVILATSHYSGWYDKLYQETPFVISQKNFSLPNGETASNTSFNEVILNSFQNLSQPGVSFQDRAHRIEHSIELHLLFLNHIWSHEFEIIPILVGGLDELFYSTNSFREEQVEAFTQLLRKEYADDEDTFFLISGDLSHIGHKFGDQKPASQLFDEVKLNDERFLEIGATGSPDKLLGLMKEEYDPYRICGFPPLFTFLKTFPGLKGEILSYDLWDEREQESAVSFGSILFN